MGKQTLLSTAREGTDQPVHLGSLIIAFTVHEASMAPRLSAEVTHSMLEKKKRTKTGQSKFSLVGEKMGFLARHILSDSR